MSMRVLIFSLSFLLVVLGAPRSWASQEVVIDGGGWGHGIGMSQYGARALAEQGKSAEQIMAHFYTGSSMGTVGTGGLVGHAEPLRIGVAPKQTSLGFQAVGGQLALCLQADCFTASPGESWSLRAMGLAMCQFFKDGIAQGDGPRQCGGAITWSGQPGVRVTFPSLNRTYARGQILILPAPNDQFHMVVEIGLEEYLYGLGEMPSSWHVEALRAQAIAGRTYALYKAWVYRYLSTNQARLDACGCHLYASTQDQKYIGWAKEAEGTNGHWGDRWRQAVDATRGRAVIHAVSQGRAIQAYYFSSSGGSTENNEDVWGGSPFVYLRSVGDPGASSWVKTIDKATMAAALGLDRVFDATITGTYASGSPSGIRVRGLLGGSLVTKTYTGAELRSRLGLKSHFIKAFSGFLPPNFDEFLGADFDGDGADEVAAFSTHDGSWWIFDRISGTLIGSEWADFVTAKGWATEATGDFNGDGKDDVANFHPSNGTWWVSRSTGSGFVTSLWADFTTAKGWGPQLVGDFNGDGKDDVANFHDSNGTWWVSQSTGSVFNTSWRGAVSPGKGWQGQVVGDFDGDGDDDLSNFYPSTHLWVIR